MDWKTIATLSVTLLVALFGYLATYLNNLRLAQRKDRLERLDRQLRELYGILRPARSSGVVAGVARCAGPAPKFDALPTAFLGQLRQGVEDAL